MEYDLLLLFTNKWIYLKERFKNQIPISILFFGSHYTENIIYAFNMYLEIFEFLSFFINPHLYAITAQNDESADNPPKIPHRSGGGKQTNASSRQGLGRSRDVD